jgi:hypothetical protein
MLRLQSLLYAIVPFPELFAASGMFQGNHVKIMDCCATVSSPSSPPTPVAMESAGGSALKSGLKTSQNTCRYNLCSNPSH